MNHPTLNLTGSGWYKFSLEPGKALHLKGHAFLDNHPISGADLATQLLSAKTAKARIALLSRLNGFYAWVYQLDHQILAAVDHIRSRPLFYGHSDQRIFVSDNAEWVRVQVGDQTMDPLARDEFLLAGYVTGPDTLFPHVKQLQAGEYLLYEGISPGARVETQRYYRFLHKEPEQFDQDRLKANLESAALSSMRRLIEYADGRPLVVPLSGGHDSRLIVTLLKRLDYKNVLAFSYGLAGNKESTVSYEIAKALGFQWTFVEYTNSLWAQAWSSTSAQSFRALASNHSSLPNVQDWLAVKVLVDTQRLPQDAILVPGHTGDFVAGGHIPMVVFEKENLAYAELINALVDRHLSNAPHVNCTLMTSQALCQRVSDAIDLPYDGTSDNFANLYEYWEWQERQAKYIANCVRVYDQFNLDWWMPLWDKEFVAFWETVPLVLRRGRLWFMDWIDAEFLSCAGLEHEKIIHASKNQSLGLRVAKQFMGILPAGVIKMVRTYRMRHSSIQEVKNHINHPLAFGGLVPRESLTSYLSQGYNIIGMYTDLHLNNEWDKIAGW